MRFSRRFMLGLAVAVPVSTLGAQGGRGLDSLLAPHRAAMKALAALDGVWQGDGRIFSASGDQSTFQQTIRVTSLGEGTIKLLEGRSYGRDGQSSNYSVELISFLPATSAYSLRVYTQGAQADLPLRPLNGGFTLEYPDGATTVRFTISVTADTWHEVAERRPSSGEPFRFLELNLRRAGKTEPSRPR